MISKWLKSLTSPRTHTPHHSEARGDNGNTHTHISKDGQSARAGNRPAQSSEVTSDASHSDTNAGSRRSRNRGGNHKKSKSEATSDWSPAQFVVPPETGKTRFHDLNLDPRLLHGIADLGFTYCSPIQAEVLPKTLRGHDAVGKAQTGSGKTAAFLITVFNDLLSNPVTEERFVGEPRALVIAPTRELVQQIADDAEKLSKHTGLNVVALIGGMDYQRQLNQLQLALVDVVVATPGRLLDFQQRKDLYLDQVELLVIDEADRMLDMGFIPQVKRIVRSTPQTSHRQTLFFSATFSPDIINLTEQWTHEAVRVEIEPESIAAENVDQKVYMVTSSEKFRLLRNILKQPDATSVIVFANRRDETRWLFEKLERGGVSCGMISGEIPQNKRTRTLQDFKDGKIQVLVATDVAGRGIHVDGVTHVVNYALPEDPEDYVHRIGRTGRAGAFGVSISFASEDDGFLLPSIEQLLGRKLDCELPPESLLS